MNAPAKFSTDEAAHDPIDADEFADAICGALDEAARQREAAQVDEDFKDDLPDPNDPKTLVQRSRAHLQGILDDLTERKQRAERRMALAGERCNERQAAAQRAYDDEKVAALAEHVAALADAEADLAQITAAKEAIDLAVARLNKA
jgi:hypothetical protein